MPIVGVVSLGCAKNQVDTERMLALLIGAGYTLTNDPEEADVLIVNTCAFIESAKQESIDAIFELAQYKKTARCKTLVVTGCLSERYRAELRAELPEVDLLLGVREYSSLLRLLGDAETDAPACGAQSARILTTPPHRAYLRVADGCDNRCAYCAIPLIRGRLASEPIEALADEAKRLADGGVTELSIIAQDTTAYGRDRYGKPMLAELLSRLEQIDALRWLRVLYAYPEAITPALIMRMRESQKIVPYLDMPMQHVDDEVLRRMHRRGNGAQIARLLDYIGEHAPEFVLRTTFLVGFPGETDAAFERLMRFLDEHPFHRVGAFAYSPEENTAAAAMPGQVPDDVKRARLHALLEKQRHISLALQRKRVGERAAVLVEGFDGKHAYGRSYAEAPDVDGRVYIETDAPLPIGSYRDVRLTRALEYDMIGVPEQ